MIKYILRRLLVLVPVLVGISFIIFFLLYITPGDPARVILGENEATEEAVAQLREEMGLDDPFLIQYFNYMKKMIVHQDIGKSYVTKRPVMEIILDVFPATFKLASLSILLSLIIGIPFGIISAIKQYSVFDSITMVLALIGISMPMFWLALLMILFFSVKLGWFPSSGFDSFRAMVLPSAAIALQCIAIFTRMTRSSMLETIRKDYIRTARAKGQSEFKVIGKHSLSNALIPIITVAGLQFGHLLGGAVLTESIFSIPGVGRIMVEAIKMRDYPVVQGGVLMIAVCFCLVNLVVDILYAYVDPRVKSQYR